MLTPPCAVNDNQVGLRHYLPCSDNSPVALPLRRGFFVR